MNDKIKVRYLTGCPGSNDLYTEVGEVCADALRHLLTGDLHFIHVTPTKAVPLHAVINIMISQTQEDYAR